MKGTFSDPAPSLRIEMAPMPNAPFVLRFDYQATQEGRMGGLPFQSIEWETVNASTWELAKQEARQRVESIPACRWHGQHYLQGVVLVEVTAAYPFRTLAFRRN